MECGLSLGSNQGRRLSLLRRARDAIAAEPGLEVVAQSPVYETQPVGVRPEHRRRRFLNAVLIVNTACEPRELIVRLHRIERALGRVRSADRYAPRRIDVDLIYAGGKFLDEGGLQVPHPRWEERRFVVQPLADVRPDLVLPGAAHTVRDVLADLPREPSAVLLHQSW